MDSARRLHTRLRQEQSGFMLIELLVVTIIIGILAAIALAVFITEKDKAQDADAKSNVSAVGAYVESCWADAESLRDCDEPSEYKPDGIDVASSSGPPPNDCNSPASEPPVGEVAVTASENECYVVTATSESDDGGATHVFTAVRRADGTRERRCGPVAIRGKGGCRRDGTW